MKKVFIMSYINATHADPLTLSSPAPTLSRTTSRLSESLEIAILLVTMSGVSLVLSTIVAGAF